MLAKKWHHCANELPYGGITDELTDGSACWRSCERHGLDIGASPSCPAVEQR
jgi:hypothetical protein